MEAAERLIVVQDNDLINTPYVLSLNEKRLMMLIIAKINPNRMPKKNEVFTATVTLQEWRSHFGTTSKSLYSQLYKACEALVDRPALRIPTGGDKPALAPWVSYAKPDKEEQSIEVKLVYELLLFLQGFTELFTQYDIANVKDMRSVYSVRLYELLIQYKKIGKRAFKLDDFRAVIDPNNTYHRWPDLRRYIIDRAIADINAETDLHVDWQQSNHGRKVTHIEFVIRQKPNRNLKAV
jgi:plasmid replication initiation protein